MAIVINGSGTVTGLAVGGLPDGTVDAGTLATNSVDSAELIDGAVDNSHMAAMAASKLTGALPAISGASLTGIVTGKVLQMKHSSTTASASSTNNTVTIQTITLTKISSTSKLLIKGWAYLGQKVTGVSTDGANPTLTLENGSTEILKFYHSDVPMWYTSGTYNGTYDTHYYAGEILYTIGSGSITINLKLGSSIDGVWVNRSAGASNGFGQTGITIMEIEV